MTKLTSLLHAMQRTVIPTVLSVSFSKLNFVYYGIYMYLTGYLT